MVNQWVNQDALRQALAGFFSENSSSVSLFGNTVNQTFEAFVFASVAEWYRSKGWDVGFRHPRKKQSDSSPGQVRLKFSTNGMPKNYSFVECKKDGIVVHVRHQIRVATKSHQEGNYPPANVCLDVAVLKETDVSSFSNKDAVPNDRLITFGEAKHMSAFAELIANFEGLVHELQPVRLKKKKAGILKSRNHQHPSPFLYVSGILYPTAQGILNTIEAREFDVNVFNKTKGLVESFELPVCDPPPKLSSKPKSKKKAFPVEELPF